MVRRQFSKQSNDDIYKLSALDGTTTFFKNFIFRWLHTHSREKK